MVGVKLCSLRSQILPKEVRKSKKQFYYPQNHFFAFITIDVGWFFCSKSFSPCILFTEEEYIYDLCKAFSNPLLKKDGKIWLAEYSPEDKQKLIEKGFDLEKEKISIIIAYNSGDCFVNVFY